MNESHRISPDSPALEERLRILKETIPECFTEGKLDPDRLRDLLGEANLEEGLERYGLFWPGKREARARAFKPSKMALHRAPKDGVNEENTRNLIIEGENLEVLKLLSKSYRGRVKMIYIDPPYNTGNDFVYDDKFAENPLEYEKRTGLRAEDGTALQTNRKSSGRHHSNWLSLMLPRLTLARELLRKDGFIAVSIDENELANLRSIMDEVFGPEAFHSTVIVQSNKRGHTYDEIAKTHEYLLIYGRSDEAQLGELEKEENDLNLFDAIGPFNIRELRNRNPKFGKHNRPNLYYSFFIDTHTQDKDGFCPVALEAGGVYKHQVEPLNSEGKESCWRWGKTKASKNISLDTQNSNLVAKSKQGGGYNIYEKYRKSTAKAKSIWVETSVITEQGTIELGKLGMAALFDFPKPLGLLRKVLQLIIQQDEDSIEEELQDTDNIVLDFFAGSGTTAQAVLELNEEDGGNRQFILVQMPEATPEDSEARKAGYETIAELTKERVRRVIKKIETEKGKLSDRDRGFRVYKLAKTGFKEWRDYEGGSLEEYEKQLSLHLAETDEKAREEDLVAEIMLREGFPLDSKVERLEEGSLAVTRIESESSGHRLFVCLDEGFGRSLTVRTFEKLGIAQEDVFVCLDSALSDEAKLRIRELCRLATI